MTDDLTITYRDPAGLVDYERNARTHTPEQIIKLRRLIDAFGFTNPILLKGDGKTIGAGHGRRMAALLDPPLDRVPTIDLTGISEAQWAAFVIADNKIAEEAGWDDKLLKLELDTILAGGLSIDLTGFALPDLEALNLRLNPAAGDPIGQVPADAYKEQFGVVVVCKGEAEQKATYERLLAEGLVVKVVKV